MAPVFKHCKFLNLIEKSFDNFHCWKAQLFWITWFLYIAQFFFSPLSLFSTFTLDFSGSKVKVSVYPSYVLILRLKISSSPEDVSFFPSSFLFFSFPKLCHPLFLDLDFLQVPTFDFHEQVIIILCKTGSLHSSQYVNIRRGRELKLGIVGF